MEDLSHLVPGLLGGESESAANMVSVTPPHGADGSVSEASATLTTKGSSNGSAGTPGPVIPPKRDRTTVTHADSSSAPDLEWKHADGRTYAAAGDELSAGNAPLGGWSQVL